MFKVVKFVNDFENKALTFLFILVFLVGAYFAYDSLYVFYNSKAELASLPKPLDSVDLVELKEINEDMVAWIRIYDTDLDYPIMQGENNTEYLTKNPYGEYSLGGSIFLDTRNSSDFTDNYSLVYGHHMANNAMFGVLDKWLEKDYFNNHRDGVLICGEDEYKIKVFAYLDTDSSEDLIFNPEYSYPLQYIKQNARYYYAPEGERLVALSTCKAPTSTKRTVLFCFIDVLKEK